MTRLHARAATPAEREPPGRARAPARAVDQRATAPRDRHLGDTTVGELVSPALWYRDRAARVPELLAAADTEDQVSVLHAIQAIAEHEAIRRFLAPLLDLPVSLDREARSLPPGVAPTIDATCLGVPLPLDAAGHLSLASLDEVAATSLAALLAEELVAAAQLLEIEGAMRRVEELAALPETLADVAAHPSKYPLAAAEALRAAAHSAWGRARHLHDVALPSNADQLPRLAVASDRAYTLYQHARLTHAAARVFHEEKLQALTWAPGEGYFSHEADNLERGGVLGYAGWGATKVFHTVGNAMSAGALDRGANNNRAYRAGSISWDAYRHNDHWNWVATAAEAVATALAGRAGGRLAAFGLEKLGVSEVSGELSTQLATRLTASTTARLTHGLVGGTLVGSTAPATDDAVALVSAYASDDPHIKAYQLSLIGGPETWAQGGGAGALLGLAGGALSTRWPTRTPYDWQGFEPDGWIRTSLDDVAPVVETLPPPIVKRLEPARAALARRDVWTAMRVIDDVATIDRMPASLVSRIEREMVAELTGDQAITPLSSYRTPRALLPDGRWVEPTAWDTPRFYGLGISDAVALRLMEEGLPARGPNLDLLDHTLQRDGSAFRGTTAEILTQGGAGEQQGAGAWADDGGWVFEIDGIPSWHVDNVLQGRVPTVGGFTNPLMGAEAEHSILAGVPSDRIVSIRKMRRIHGRLRPGAPIKNPNYRGSR